MYLCARLKLKRTLLTGLTLILVLVSMSIITINKSTCNDCFIDYKLSINLDRGWYPPRKYRSDLDEYLIYGQELLPALNQSRTQFNHQCPQSTKYVVFVHSCIDCWQSRTTIRKTWASPSILTQFNVTVVFAIGKALNHTSLKQDQLIAENQLHQDLVQFDFIDSYRNVTIKTVAGLNWAAVNCPTANFVIKADDDLYYNLERITNYLIKLSGKDLNSVLGFHFSSYDWFNHDPSSKQYIPKAVSFSNQLFKLCKM